MSAPSRTFETAGRGVPKGAWQILTLLCAINIINFLDKSALGLVAIPIREEFHLSPTQFGMIGSAFFLVFAVSAAGLSWLGNRHSPRRLLLGLVVLWSLLQLPIAIAGTVTLLVVARLVLAAFEAPMMPLTQVALHQWYPEKLRQAPTMVFHASGPIGAIVMIPVLVAVSAHLGWRELFVVLACAGLVVGVVWALVAKDGPISDRTPGTAPDALAPIQARVPYRTILLSGTFIGAALALFVAQWSIALASAWIPAYFEEGLGLTPGMAGTLVGVMYAFVTAGMLFYGVLSQRRSARGADSRSARVRPLAVMFVAAAAVIVVSTLVHAPLVSGLTLALGLGLAQGGFGIGSVVLGEIVPQSQRAAVLGIMVTVAATGSTLAPTVFGVLVQHGSTTLTGYHQAWWLTAALFAVMAAAIVRLIRTDRDGIRYAAAAQPAPVLPQRATTPKAPSHS